jgi:hypothetical protein
MMTLEWDGLFFEGDNGDYDDMEWDSLSNQQFLRGDDEDPEWDSYRKSIIRLFFL